MPSTDAPTFYDRAGCIVASYADEFLRWLDRDEYIAVTGDVESPVGWVGIIKIDPRMIATWVSSAGDPWMSERRNFVPGWYIVRINECGLVWGLWYGGWCDQHEAFCTDTHAEESAWADFNKAESVYDEWLDSVGE